MRLLETTDPIALAVTASQPVTIRHGLGRQVQGWLVIWCTAPVEFFAADAAADTRTELVLVPSATCDVRLLLL
jgi:hypothetical protein